MSEEVILQEIYNDSLIRMNDVFTISDEEKNIIDDAKPIDSDLDKVDYCFSIMFGVLGVFIATNKELENFLKNVHDAASGNVSGKNSVEKFLGKMLEHKGSYMDKPLGVDPHKYINRQGETANGFFHRLLYGHDILSPSSDNPFFLGIKQYGPFLGVVNTIRHLIADTMSKQGLPIPGHSLLDSKSNGSNYIIDLCSELKKSTGTNKQINEIYSHLATIRMQDIIDLGLVTALNEIYFSVRKIDDDIRKIQFRIISFSVNFFGQAIYDMCKQNGIPYINFPVASAMIKNVVMLYVKSNQETRKLRKITNELINKSNNLEADYYEVSGDLVSYETAEEYIEELERGQKNVDEMIDFMEGW